MKCCVPGITWENKVLCPLNGWLGPELEVGAMNEPRKPETRGGTQAEKRRLNIDFLYLDLSVCERCQDTESTLEEAIEDVARVLDATGVEVALNKIQVTSEAEAVALGFLVSPTIRVNGRDIQMNFRESLCEPCGTLCECEEGVSCREWEYQGRWYTAPPKGLIIEAILKEVYGGAGEGRDAPRKGKEAPDNLKRFFEFRGHT